MDFFKTIFSSDAEEDDVADDKLKKNMNAPFIQTNNVSDNFGDGNNRSEPRKECYLDTEVLDNSDVSAFFAAQLQNVAFAQDTFGSHPAPRFRRTFDGIPIDTRAARGSSASNG